MARRQCDTPLVLSSVEDFTLVITLTQYSLYVVYIQGGTYYWGFSFFAVFFYMLGKWCSLYICMYTNLNSLIEGKLQCSYTQVRSCTGNEYTTSVGQLPEMETNNWQFSKIHNQRLFSWPEHIANPGSSAFSIRIIWWPLKKGCMEVVDASLQGQYEIWLS